MANGPLHIEYGGEGHKRRLSVNRKQTKQTFINVLDDKVLEDGCTVHHAQADADLLIVQTAIEYTVSMKTTIIGDDTDLLVLLCYYLDTNSHYVFLSPQPKKKSKNHRKWNIKETKTKLGKLLFVHALMPPCLLILCIVACDDFNTFVMSDGKM